jgi:hypothetical protein
MSELEKVFSKFNTSGVILVEPLKPQEERSLTLQERSDWGLYTWQKIHLIFIGFFYDYILPENLKKNVYFHGVVHGSSNVETYKAYTNWETKKTQFDTELKSFLTESKKRNKQISISFMKFGLGIESEGHLTLLVLYNNTENPILKFYDSHGKIGEKERCEYFKNNEHKLSEIYWGLDEGIITKTLDKFEQLKRNSVIAIQALKYNLSKDMRAKANTVIKEHDTVEQIIKNYPNKIKIECEIIQRQFIISYQEPNKGTCALWALFLAIFIMCEYPEDSLPKNELMMLNITDQYRKMLVNILQLTPRSINITIEEAKSKLLVDDVFSFLDNYCEVRKKGGSRRNYRKKTNRKKGGSRRTYRLKKGGSRKKHISKKNKLRKYGGSHGPHRQVTTINIKEYIIESLLPPNLKIKKAIDNYNSNNSTNPINNIETKIFDTLAKMEETKQNEFLGAIVLEHSTLVTELKEANSILLSYPYLIVRIDNITSGYIYITLKYSPYESEYTYKQIASLLNKKHIEAPDGTLKEEAEELSINYPNGISASRYSPNPKCTLKYILIKIPTGELTEGDDPFAATAAGAGAGAAAGAAAAAAATTANYFQPNLITIKTNFPKLF